MAINYAIKYATKIAERFKKASITADDCGNSYSWLNPNSRTIRIGSAGPRKQVEMLLFPLVPDLSALDQQIAESLAKAAIAANVPFLPGTATSSDIMRGLDLGLDRFKFFPAEANGGIPALKAIAAPFGMVRFCPTGGITAATAPDWLALDPVLCCGGSWLVPKGAPDVAAIEAAARAAAALGQ